MDDKLWAVGLDDGARIFLTEHVHQVCSTLGQRQGQLQTGTQVHRYTALGCIGLDDVARLLLTEHVHQACSTLGQRQGQLYTGIQVHSSRL